LGQEFFIGFARNAGITLHLRELCGTNAHHVLEATFKACARALRVAFESDPRVDDVPSTKGVL
jgi:imidazoleglycerol-phosphate dehydratase